MGYAAHRKCTMDSRATAARPYWHGARLPSHHSTPTTGPASHTRRLPHAAAGEAGHTRKKIYYLLIHPPHTHPQAASARAAVRQLRAAVADRGGSCPVLSSHVPGRPSRLAVPDVEAAVPLVALAAAGQTRRDSSLPSESRLVKHGLGRPPAGRLVSAVMRAFEATGQTGPRLASLPPL